MKKLLTLLLLVICTTASAQIYQNRPEYGWRFNRTKIDSTLTLPKDTSLRSNVLDPGALIYNTGDSALYVWNGAWWLKQGRVGAYGTVTVPILHDSLNNMTLQRVTENGDTTNRQITIKNRSTSALTIQQYSANSQIRFIDSTGLLHGAIGDVGTSNNFEISAYAGPLAITSATTSPIQFRVNSTQIANMDDSLTSFNTVVAGITPVLSNHLTTKNYVDTALAVRIWQYPMTPLVTQPAVPIQPTNTIPEAAGKLQAQINSFTGKYIEVAPAAYQNNTAAKVNGTVNIASTTISPYLIMLERNNNTGFDAVIGYKVGSDTSWTGMGNRNNNDYTITMPKSKTRLVNADTSGIQFISFTAPSTAKIYTRTRNGLWMFGDDLSPVAVPLYPLHVTNTNDTSLYAPHKIVMDINLSTSDSGRIVAPTDWVKKQAYLKQSNANLQTVLSTGSSATLPLSISATANSNWAATFSNNGTTTANGVYLNIGASSTGTIFRADKNGTSKLQVTNAGATQVGGSLYLPFASISTNTTLDDTYYTVRATASGITITLPSAGASFSGGAGKVYVIMNDNTGGSITISSFQNNGSAVTTIANNTKIMLQSNGTNWYQTN